ncbi:MAG: hypothetical protein ACTSRR_12815 [Candidatus Heimdallarchaeaceae archaeon]
MNKSSVKRNLMIVREQDVVVTGGVVFIGDGHTGKTHTALNLVRNKDRYKKTDLISKSINVEFDYFVYQSNYQQYKFTISAQLFIFPGQKGRAKKGEGLAFEDALDLYFDVRTVKEVIVLILTFNLTDIATFQNLEYWVKTAIENNLVSEATNIILLGTHYDKKSNIAVNETDIINGKKFVQEKIANELNIDFPLKQITEVNISNLTEEGIENLIGAITDAFFNVFNIDEFNLI